MVALLAVVGVTACGGGSSSSASSATAPATGNPAPATVTIGLPLKVSDLDPDLALEPSNLDALHLLSGTLTTIPGKGGALQPGLASSWQVASNQLSVTFRLRPGLKFSDGSPLTSADVVATFKRSLADAANVNAGLLAPVKSVTAPDASTVVFNLKSTYPSLPTVLGEPAFLVFPASGMADTKTFLKNPISAGPYKIETWDGSDITLVKNPNFWGPKPAVNTIKLVTVIDPNTRLVQLKGGELDIADSLSSSVIPQLTGNLRPSITPLYGAVYLYVNNRNAPLDNTNVRQAISLAMDRDQINQIAFSGKSSISDAFFPQTFQCCYQPSFPSQQNIDKAKSLLAGTPCANGCNLKLMLRNGLDYADRAGVVVQQNLKAIGINASIQQVDPSVAGEAEGNGTFELEVNSLYDYVDIPDGMLTYGLISDGGINALFSGYDSPQMDAAANRAIASAGAARTDALSQVSQIFAKDMPYVPLVGLSQINGTGLSQDWVYLGASSFYDVQPAGG